MQFSSLRSFFFFHAASMRVQFLLLMSYKNFVLMLHLKSIQNGALISLLNYIQIRVRDLM